MTNPTFNGLTKVVQWNLFTILFNATPICKGRFCVISLSSHFPLHANNRDIFHKKRCLVHQGHWSSFRVGMIYCINQTKQTTVCWCTAETESHSLPNKQRFEWLWLSGWKFSQQHVSVSIWAYDSKTPGKDDQQDNISFTFTTNWVIHLSDFLQQMR